MVSDWEMYWINILRDFKRLFNYEKSFMVFNQDSLQLKKSLVVINQDSLSF